MNTTAWQDMQLCYNMLAACTAPSATNRRKKMIDRLRKDKRRWGVTRGRAFTGYHFGKRSWYIAHDKALSGLTINDWHGLTETKVVK